MTDHIGIRAELADYLEGSLSSEGLRRMGAHVLECSECALLFAHSIAIENIATSLFDQERDTKVDLEQDATKTHERFKSDVAPAIAELAAKRRMECKNDYMKEREKEAIIQDTLSTAVNDESKPIAEQLSDVWELSDQLIHVYLTRPFLPADLFSKARSVVAKLCEAIDQIEDVRNFTDFRGDDLALVISQMRRARDRLASGAIRLRLEEREFHRDIADLASDLAFQLLDIRDSSEGSTKRA